MYNAYILMEDKLLKVARQAAIEAGKIITIHAGDIHQKNTKFGDISDFATEVDIEAEKVILSIISEAFPEHNIISEEKGKTDKGSEYTWVIDPLDGTFAFAHNVPYFSVAIGLLQNNKPVLGVVNHVSTGDLYHAQAGKGAYLNDKKIQVSKVTALDEAAVVLDFGHIAKRPQRIAGYIDKLINKVGYPYSFGPIIMSMAILGTGSFDGAVSMTWLWDLTAGTVIVKEAGGKVTDFEGNEPDWTQDRLSIVASNGLIHSQILNHLKGD